MHLPTEFIPQRQSRSIISGICERNMLWGHCFSYFFSQEARYYFLKFFLYASVSALVGTLSGTALEGIARLPNSPFRNRVMYPAIGLSIIAFITTACAFKILFKMCHRALREAVVEEELLQPVID